MAGRDDAGVVSRANGPSRARARDAPSPGSVPAPTSSSSTRALRRRSRRMRTMLLTWPENVDSDCCKALLVADVREDLIKDIHFGPRGGNMEAALRHERQQAGGFQADRLAARVRPGNQQYLVLRPRRVQCQSEQRFWVQAADAGRTARRVRPEFVQGRLNGAVRFGQFGAGGDKIYLAQMPRPSPSALPRRGGRCRSGAAKFA